MKSRSLRVSDRGEVSKTKRSEISICKLGGHAILKIGDEAIAVKDYKISSSMYGRTELEVVFEFDSKITEFSTEASS